MHTPHLFAISEKSKATQISNLKWRKRYVTLLPEPLELICKEDSAPEIRKRSDWLAKIKKTCDWPRDRVRAVKSMLLLRRHLSKAFLNSKKGAKRFDTLKCEIN